MEIAPFTTPFTDKLCTRLGIEYVPEFLSRARSEEDTVLMIPGYRQTKSYTCGFVCGLMALQYFKPKANVKKFYELCRLDDDWGAGTRKVSTALRQSGLKVGIKKGLTFDDIADAMEAGRPVLTSIKRKGQIQHWVAIYGCNRKTKELFVASDKFWFSLYKTIVKWNKFRHKLPAGVDFLICSKK